MLQDLREHINHNSRSPGMYSLHLHKVYFEKGIEEAYFHVDTYSGSFFSDPITAFKHLWRDVIVGTWRYDVTGLPGR